MFTKSFSAETDKFIYHCTRHFCINVHPCSLHSQGVAESESRRAGDLAETTYKQNFDAAIVADETALMAEHQVGGSCNGIRVNIKP